MHVITMQQLKRGIPVWQEILFPYQILLVGPIFIGELPDYDVKGDWGGDQGCDINFNVYTVLYYIWRFI